MDSQVLDPARLKDAYRKVLYAKPVVNLAASFIFAGGFEVKSEDESAIEALKKFWARNEGELQQAGVEFCLYGNTWLALEFEGGELKLRVLPPDSVNVKQNQEQPWVIDGYEIVQTYVMDRGQVKVKQTLSADTWKIELNGVVKSSGRNPYGIIPIVQVAATKFSDELYGTGEIDEALHETLTMYQLARNKGVKIENYHGGPMTVVRGVKDFELLKPKLESGDAAGVGFGVVLPDKDADMFFLESKRPTTERIELLKLLYHAIVVQSETPEYLLGVGMPDSSGATKEQRAPVERKAKRLRPRWGDALRAMNGIVLRAIEYHELVKFGTYETDIEWGPLFDRDEKQDAEVLNTRSQAVMGLADARIISVKTARKESGIVEDPEAEQKQIDKEQAQRQAEVEAEVEAAEPEGLTGTDTDEQGRTG